LTGAPPGDAQGLVEALARAEAALAAGDVAAADAALAAAAEACQRLERAGTAVAGVDREALAQAARRCGEAIGRLAGQLNTDSMRGEQVVRGLVSYQRNLPRRL
jgi:hypothetical protein